MIYDLVNSNDPILRAKMPAWDFRQMQEEGIDAWELSDNLIETMRANKGLGLSANQVGLPYRVFVMEGEPAYACFNPRIVDATQETIISLDEGCLSFPNLYVKVKRPRLIKVRFQDPNGDVHTVKFDGMTARVFQHEFDHLEGIDYRKRANRYHLERAQKLKKKLDRGLKQADESSRLNLMRELQHV